MSDPDIEWQKLLYATITAAVAPVAVEVHPPHNTPLPFVRIGETYVQEHVLGHEIRADVHTFSATEGGHECKATMHKIREALHGMGFNGGGWEFTCCREEDARVFFDADEEEWHSIQTIRVLAST